MDIASAQPERHLPSDSSSDATQAVLCRAVARLYDVTLDLTSVASQTEPRFATRIMAGVAEIDEAIRQLRHDMVGPIDTVMIASAPTTTRFL